MSNKERYTGETFVVYRHREFLSNGEVLRADGTWSRDRYDAAVCIDLLAVESFLQANRIECYGRPLMNALKGSCGILRFCCYDDYEKWASSDESQFRWEVIKELEEKVEVLRGRAKRATQQLIDKLYEVDGVALSN